MTATYSPAATADVLPKRGLRQDPYFPQGHRRSESQDSSALGDTNFTDGQGRNDSHSRAAVGEPFSNPGAKVEPEPSRHLPQGSISTPDQVHTGTDAQCRNALVGPPTPTVRQARGESQASPAHRGPILRDPVLGVLADVLDDLEAVKIANANRVATLTRVGADSDGVQRGHGLTLDNPEVAALVASVEMLTKAEHDAILNLQRAMRKHPLGPFVKATKGLGEKQAARLIASIGDPYWNDLHNRPRTVSELWAYCGLDPRNGVARKRAKGERANWSADGKKRAWLIASKMVMVSGSAYRPLYDATKAHYADAVHNADCVRCGPAGKPALAGSPISDGHRHARALRAVSKELLKDLWIQSREIHYREVSA